MNSKLFVMAAAGAALLASGMASAQAEAPKEKKGMLGGLFGAVAGAPKEAAKDEPKAEDEEEAPVKDPGLLQSGVEVAGSLKSAPKSPNNNLYRCYQIETTRGSRWNIHVTQKKQDWKYLKPLVFAGTSCIGVQAQPVEQTEHYEPQLVGGDWYGTNTKFAAGGGLYSVAVLAPAGANFGGFRITATQTAGAGSVKTGLLANTDDVAYASEYGKATASTVEVKEKGKYSTGDVIKDCPDCPSMIVVPAGQFIMGSTSAEEDRNGDEGPAHRVKIANAFAMGQLEVTFAEWDACVKDGACVPANDNGWGRGKRPVINVNWNEIRTYIGWLSKKTGERYFLPSEAEWEYAARAGTKTPWNTGSGIVSDDANILNTFKQTVPGGGFPANAFGLKDVHGNVLEWVLDCYEVGYFGVPEDGGAAVTEGCPTHVIRGGSFASEPKWARSASRSAYPVEAKNQGVGFRVARAL